MLSTHERVRYSRQILLKPIDEKGQQALINATVVIVGIGGLGNPAALYLAAAGVGNLILIDGDNVDVSNLPRQILFSEQDVNQNKADIAAEKLQQQFPELSVEVVDEMLTDENATLYFEQADIVLDCSDNIATRYLINKHCVTLNKPLVIASATGFDGQHLFVNPQNPNSACYHCLYPETEKAPANNCQTAGIIGPTLQIISGMQVLTCIKYITGMTLPINQLSVFDGITNQWQQFSLSKQSHCAVCHEKG